MTRRAICCAQGHSGARSAGSYAAAPRSLRECGYKSRPIRVPAGLGSQLARDRLRANDRRKPVRHPSGLNPTEGTVTSVATLRNQNGVVIDLTTTAQGARLTLAPGGVNVTLSGQ
jgi:hypothetical protein